MIKLQKTYDPKNVEDKIYKLWEKSGYFNPDKLPATHKKPFTISMPPPNATGILHIGHAVMLAIQDILIRFKRMQGFRTLWLPGIDHAAIATSSVVEKKLWNEKRQTRQDLGREKFLDEIEKFVEQSKSVIRSQIKKMGSSCDWSREAYTLDESRSRAVRMVFKMMYNDDLIYRGERIVNWCPRCGSTLSDDEVTYKMQKAKFYTFKYSKGFPFAIATTRPETKLGDTAVAVNPKDARYKKYIGKTYEINFVGVPLKIKIIAERSIDMTFGTGALGLTPAHSMIDWQMAEKNNLPIIKVIDKQAKIRPGFADYSGKITTEAREMIVEKLEEEGLLEKEEEIEHNLAVCYRCGMAIEPMPLLQWFVNVNSRFEMRDSRIKGFKKGDKVTLKELAIAAVKNNQIKIIPERFKKVYFRWIEDLRDWCISRQIWFGHRIPVWYRSSCFQPSSKRGGDKGKGENHEEIYVDVKSPKDGEWKQDEDTLDTWFSSGLWTFSTLGWPKATTDLKIYHPTSVMETGYDLIFFWIARMILMTTYALGEIPFETVYLHGLVLDKYGEKMSKSKPETCIDPSDVCQKYGTDAVRLSLVLGTSPGNDFRLYDEKIAGFRNFTNKLWNIGRYVMASTKSKIQNPKQIRNSKFKIRNSTLTEKWILSRLNSVIDQVTNHLNKFEFSQAGEKLRAFTWNEFADWYIEINKIQPNNSLLLNSYFLILKLWHPFMPFVTEELWARLGKGNKKLLMIAEWPESNRNWQNKKAEKDFEILRNIVIAIRSLRTDYKIEPKKKILAILYGGTKTKLIGEQADIIKFLAGIGKLEIKRSGKKPPRSASAIVTDVKIYLPLAGLINIKEKRERLEKELIKMENYLAILKKKLTNQSFIKQAPKEIVAREKQKLQDQQEKLRALKNKLKLLK